MKYEDEYCYEYDDIEEEDPIVRLEKMIREEFPEEESITGYIGEGSRQLNEYQEVKYKGELIEVDEVEKYIGTIDENEIVSYSASKGMALNQINVLNDNSTNNTYYQDQNIIEELRQVKEEIKSIKDILITKTKEDKQKEELYNKIDKLNSFIDKKVEEINRYSNTYNTTSYKENNYVKETLKNFMHLNPKLKKQDIINVAIITFIEKFNK